VIPKERHFGYDNYFMMKLKNISQNNNVKVKILNEGEMIFPF